MLYNPNAGTVRLLSIIFLGLLSIVASPVWAQQTLENPQPGSFQSGVGVISGWACDAEEIAISFNGGPRVRAGSGTVRDDTAGVCGDTDNGFGLLTNWNRLGDGTHTVTAYADGVEFASVSIIVTTLGEEFRRGLDRIVTLPDFPDVGTDVTVVWQEAQQNFIIASEQPTIRLVRVSPQVRLPSGLQAPNLMVSSLFSEQAEVQATSAPTLLLAEDGSGTVLLALANKDGGLLRRLQDRRLCRHRVKNANFRFYTEVLIDAPCDGRDVLYEGGDSMRVLLAGRVPAVVTKIVQNDIEPVDKQRPERKIRIRRKSVGVAEDEPRPCRVAVSSQDDGGSVGHTNLGHGQRLGNLPAPGVRGGG